jgi:hypothetical protein
MADHDTSRTGMKKLSGAYASLRKDTDYTGEGQSGVKTLGLLEKAWPPQTSM